MDAGWDSFLAGMNAGNGTNNNNAMWNNPWIYFVWLALFSRGGGLFGGYGSNAESTATMEALGEIKSALASGTVARENIASRIGDIGSQLGYSKDAIVGAIINNGDKLGSAIDHVQMALCSNSKDTLMALANVGNMVQSGTASVQNAIQQCCCNTQSAINQGIASVNLEMAKGFAGTNLQNERQTNQLQSGLTGVAFANEKNFSDLRYLIAKEGCETRQSAHADRDAIIGWLTTDKIQSLQEKLTAASMEISQRNQTDALLSALRTGGGTGYGQYPYVNALFPNGSQSYPLWVNNTPQTT